MTRLPHQSVFPSWINNLSIDFKTSWYVGSAAMLAPGSWGSAAVGIPHCSSPGFICGLPLPPQQQDLVSVSQTPPEMGLQLKGAAWVCCVRSETLLCCDPSCAQPRLPGLGISSAPQDGSQPLISEAAGCKLQAQRGKAAPLGFHKSFMASHSSPGGGFWEPETSAPPPPDSFSNTPLPGAILSYFFFPQMSCRAGAAPLHGIVLSCLWFSELLT